MSLELRLTKEHLNSLVDYLGKDYNMYNLILTHLLWTLDECHSWDSLKHELTKAVAGTFEESGLITTTSIDSFSKGVGETCADFLDLLYRSTAAEQLNMVSGPDKGKASVSAWLLKNLGKK